jgi:hypothetical protein
MNRIYYPFKDLPTGAKFVFRYSQEFPKIVYRKLGDRDYYDEVNNIRNWCIATYNEECKLINENT